jgi:hypothetical protein
MTMTQSDLFNQIGDLSVDDGLKRIDRLRDNLLLGKKHLFDSGAYIGVIPTEKASEFERNFEKLMGWMDEYGQLVRRLVAAGQDRREWHCRECAELVIPWCDVCDRHDLHRRKYADLMREHGFAELSVSMFGGEIIITVRDESVMIPEEHRKKINYTLAELHELRFAGRKQIQMVHRTKKLFGGRVMKTHDPRPDYISDGAAWEQLLILAKDVKLYGPLHGFRCYGAALVKEPVTGYRITYKASREGFESQGEFDQAYTLWLGGYTPELKRLLGKIEVSG